jgi:hypothetical protein
MVSSWMKGIASWEEQAATVTLINPEGHRSPMKDRKWMAWHSRARLKKWFAGLSPEKRLELAEESERFRRDAKIVEPRRNRRRP